MCVEGCVRRVVCGDVGRVGAGEADGARVWRPSTCAWWAWWARYARERPAERAEGGAGSMGWLEWL